MMRNETFAVAAVADCASVLRNGNKDYLWRETEIGCKLLLLLQEIHQFNITYITGPQATTDYYGTIAYEFDEAVDIHAKPRTLWTSSLYNSSPILPIFIWKFGFILRSPNQGHYHFYSLPFAALVWRCLVAMILVVSVLFYVLHRAEQRLLGQKLECYFSQELLIAIAACCQHCLPGNSMKLTSRRIAFVSFFLFSYIIYSYYTSTLLSDLVHDQDSEMDLETLADSSYGYVVLDGVAVIIKVLIEQLHNTKTNMAPQHVSFIQKKLMNMRVVNMTTGLEEVRTGNTALLSDYVSLYAAIRQTYDVNLECELIKVHLFSNVLKYFSTSKNFKYIEEFKRSTLRAKETGVLKRLLKTNTPPSLLDVQCTSWHFQAQFGHVKKPLFLLGFSYILCTLILLGERAYFRRYRVWPYVE